MNLHKKIILSTTFLLLIVLGIFSWKSFELLREGIEANQKERVDLLSEIIIGRLKAIMLEGKGKELQKFLDSQVSGDIEAVRIFTEDGAILNSSRPDEIGRKVAEKDMSMYLLHESSFILKERPGGKRVYSQVILLENDPQCRGCHGIDDPARGILEVEVSAGMPEHKVKDAGKSVLTYFAITLIILSVSIGLLSLYQVKMPVAHILAVLKKVEGGDIKARITTKRKDELGQLAASLNGGISELQKMREEISDCREEIDKFRLDKSLYIEKMVSLGELAASVAHDIKNPLAGISGALQVLLEDFTGESPRREIAGEILDEIGRLDMAVKDLLMFATPPELNLIMTDINAIIDKVKDTLKARLLKQDVKINFISDKIPEVMVDPEQFGKALFNIALYCLQSMQGGGTLTISTHNKYETGEIVIVLSDTGGGIPEEYLKDVFKPFFSTKHSGTGLGLAISRNIIENHKGRIFVESRVGSGNIFRIILDKKV